MTVTFKESATAGELLTHMEQEFGIEAPSPWRVEFGTPYSPREEVVGFISLQAPYTAVSDEDRRKLKAAFDLDVPWWQKDSDGASKDKDIEGKGDVMGWEVRVTLKGAFVCTIIGQKPKPPAQYALDEAEKLRALTTEQLTYLVALKVAELEKPGVSYDVECKPA
jgi:hypothetical protein